MKNRFSGFTLAEVLMTLLIIGIVASIVIPALINETNKVELKIAAKKAVGAAQSSYNLAAAENSGGFGGYTASTITSYAKFNAIKSKMNVIKTCAYGTGSFGNCWAKDGVGQPVTYVDHCVKWTNRASGQGSNESFVAGDGSFWMLYNYDGEVGADLVAVDINGNKGPNDWGEDAFVFIMYDRKLVLGSMGCSFVKRDGSIIHDFRYLLK